MTALVACSYSQNCDTAHSGKTMYWLIVEQPIASVIANLLDMGMCCVMSAGWGTVRDRRESPRAHVLRMR